MSDRAWAHPYEDSTFYIYSEGVPTEPPSPFLPEGWRFRVTMYDHEGEAWDRETGEEWVVRPPEEWEWWDDHELIARAVIESKDDCYRGRIVAD
jgi:hypothetical protein